MCLLCQHVPGNEYMVAMSVFASKNEDRFEFKYTDFAKMLRAIGFTDHPTIAGMLCPPRRFRRFENGTLNFNYNPQNLDLDSMVSYRQQHEFKMRLKEYYEMCLHYFQPMPYEEGVVWEGD